MEFGILEIGSTNTKAYVYKNKSLINLGSKFIPFKNNYKLDNHLNKNDVNNLLEFAKKIKKQVPRVYAYGTSIFRNISEEELQEFTTLFKDKLDIDFKVVTANEENEYTVQGVLANNKYRGKMVVMIGGGGSTEIAFINNRKIITEVNLPFGAMDITEHFPELKEDIVNTNFNAILEYANKLVGELNFKANTMVLAGGDYIYFYETVGYIMEKNNLFSDENIPYLIKFPQADFYDHDILTKSLNKIKEKCPENTGWWNGARGMRFCVNSIARKTKAKYILPTKINMLIGIASEIQKNKKEEK